MNREKKYSPSVSHHDFIMKELKSLKRAAGYLNTALAEGDEDAFLLALHNVAEAQGGVSRLSRIAGIHRVSLHRILSRQGNPRLNNLAAVLHSLGLKLAVLPERQQLKQAA